MTRMSVVANTKIQPTSATQRGHRIQPHPVRPRHVRARPPQQHEADDLPDELHEDPRRDQRVDHRAEREEARHDRERAEHEQRDVREALRRVQPAEHLEEVAVPRRRIRNARVAEQQREHRAERRPQHQHREDASRPRIRRSAP